jgi:hypothetical protein
MLPSSSPAGLAATSMRCSQCSTEINILADPARLSQLDVAVLDD